MELTIVNQNTVYEFAIDFYDRICHLTKQIPTHRLHFGQINLESEKNRILFDELDFMFLTFVEELLREDLIEKGEPYNNEELSDLYVTYFQFLEEEAITQILQCWNENNLFYLTGKNLSRTVNEPYERVW